MTHNINAAKYAGNSGVSVDSRLGLWGTTTRKMKFRLSSLGSNEDHTLALHSDQAQRQLTIQLTNMPAVKRATLVPESFSLSLNCNPGELTTVTSQNGIVPSDNGANTYWNFAGVGDIVPYSQVCLRCPELSQPNSYDNGTLSASTGLAPAAGGAGPGNLPWAMNGSVGGQSNIIMSMPVLSGDGAADASDRLVQTYKTFSGNEYDCGIELANNCFQQNQWTFHLTNEFGQYYSIGKIGTPDATKFSWYAEFSIVYEPEDSDFSLN